MKIILPLVLFITVVGNCFSQDLIVTNQGDSIDCKITKVSDSYLHFTVYDGTGIVLMRSRLPLSEISFYHQSEATVEEEVTAPEPTVMDRFVLDEYEPPTFRLSATTGFTYQFGGYNGAPDSYRNQLQTLWNIGGELNYFFSETIGAGAKYTYAFTKANEDFDTPNGVVELRDELVKFNFIGASIIYRNLLLDDQTVHFTLSGGLVNYRTDLLLDGEQVFEEGDTFGVAFGVNYDYRLTEFLGVGVGLEFLVAQFPELNFNGTVGRADFNVSRVDLTAGLRFYK